MNYSDSSPASARAQRTVARVRSALESGQSPALTQIVEIIREISAHVDAISVQRLGELIARDPATMTRILQIANTLYYNPNGVEIQSITEAVHIVGFEQIRSLAVSVLLLEHVENQRSAAENREIAALALMSGLMAEELMGRRDPGRSGMAFVCSALRSYGKMLMSAFLAEDYLQARLLMPQLESDEAFTQVFGLTPLELGRRLLVGSHFPKALLDSLHSLPRKVLEKPEHSAGEELVALADLSVRLCELVEDPSLEADLYPDRAFHLAARYAKVVSLNRDDLQELVQAGCRRLQELSAFSRMKVFRSPFLERMQALADEAELPPPLLPKLASVLESDSATGDTARLTARVAETIGEAERKVATLMAQDDVSVDEVFAAAIGVVRSVLHMQEVLVFLREPDEDLFRVRLGEGELIEKVRTVATIVPSERTVLGVCLTRGEDVLIEDPRQAGIRGFIPAWLREPLQGQPLVLLPIRDAAGHFALILGVSQNRAAFELVTGAAAALRSLRKELAALGPRVRQNRSAGQ